VTNDRENEQCTYTNDETVSKERCWCR